MVHCAAVLDVSGGGASVRLSFAAANFDPARVPRRVVGSRGPYSQWDPLWALHFLVSHAGCRPRQTLPFTFFQHRCSPSGQLLPCVRQEPRL